MPLSIVLDNILETSNAQNIPSSITNITLRVDIIDAPNPCIVPAIKIVAIEIKNGNLPLQGTKLLVSIAINFSLGELIILQPVTPAALHPKSHTHSNHLFSSTRTPFKETVYIKSNSRKIS